jgi:hypothetical protein
MSSPTYEELRNSVFQALGDIEETPQRMEGAPEGFHTIGEWQKILGRGYSTTNHKLRLLREAGRLDVISRPWGVSNTTIKLYKLKDATSQN